MSINTRISPDYFLFVPHPVSELRSSSIKDPAIIFFIAGNPGLIQYYHPFLSLLAQSPSPECPNEYEFGTSQCVIAAFSLGGFEVEQQGSLHSLQDQISLTFSRIRGLVASLCDDYPHAWRRPPRVILMGHSIGAFIAMEMIRLWHETWVAPPPDPDLPEWLAKANRMPTAPYEITAAIMLTPTIVDIAKSASGQIAAPLLNYIPLFPTMVQKLVTALTWALPERAFRWVVAKVTNMPDPALSTTLAFLKSRGGVKQALSMAGEEMRELQGDRWGEEVWGVAGGDTIAATSTMDVDPTRRVQSQPARPPRLVFYFAARDHWIADTTREEFLNSRGKSVKGAKIIIEEEGKLVHGWCIAQSGFVAEKVRGWVNDILKDDTTDSPSDANRLEF